MLSPLNMQVLFLFVLYSLVLHLSKFIEKSKCFKLTTTKMNLLHCLFFGIFLISSWSQKSAMVLKEKKKGFDRSKEDYCYHIDLFCPVLTI